MSAFLSTVMFRWKLSGPPLPLDSVHCLLCTRKREEKEVAYAMRRAFGGIKVDFAWICEATSGVPFGWKEMRSRIVHSA